MNIFRRKYPIFLYFSLQLFLPQDIAGLDAGLDGKI